jgi:hypothetical protein
VTAWTLDLGRLVTGGGRTGALFRKITSMSNKSKQRARAHAAKTGMSYQAAHNPLRGPQTVPDSNEQIKQIKTRVSVSMTDHGATMFKNLARREEQSLGACVESLVFRELVGSMSYPDDNAPAVLPALGDAPLTRHVFIGLCERFGGDSVASAFLRLAGDAHLFARNLESQRKARLPRGRRVRPR